MMSPISALVKGGSMAFRCPVKPLRTYLACFCTFPMLLVLSALPPTSSGTVYQAGVTNDEIRNILRDRVVKDDKGRVTHLVWHQNHSDSLAKKIK